MSAETKAALDEALAAHVADEAHTEGAILTGYALIAASSTPEDFDNEVTRYHLEYGDRQPFHVCLGLVAHHMRHLEQEAVE